MIMPSQSAEDVKPTLIEGGPFDTYYWTGPGQRAFENLQGDDSRIIMDRVIPFIKKSVASKQPFLTVIWFHAPHLTVLTGEKYKSRYAHLSEDQQEYHWVISAMDAQIGRLNATLKNLGVDQNTLVFYSADNGPETSLEVREKISLMAERKDLLKVYGAEREACMRVVSECLVFRFGPKK